jgi:centromere/kinetochore protein ZW10
MGKTDKALSSLFQDLDLVLSYLSERLPEDLVYSLSNVMMPNLIPRIITAWLEPDVPISLKDMDEFQKIIDATKAFCGRLENLKFSRFQDLQEWVQNVPRVWLSKCRESALDSIRTKLSEGLGDPKEVERAETQTVSRAEGQKFAHRGAAATNGDGWDTAWHDDNVVANSDEHTRQTNNEDDGADAWGWGDVDEDDDAEVNQETADTKLMHDDSIEEDPTAAWGWGDEEDTTNAPKNVDTTAKEPQLALSTHELTLKETYNITSMPGPVLALVLAILEDGASLVG